MKVKPPQLGTDGTVEAKDLMIKTVLMWFELALCAFMWSVRAEWLYGSDLDSFSCVQTGYIVNT